MAGRRKSVVRFRELAPEHEKRRARQAEEDEVDRDDVAEDLSVGAGYGDHDRGDALQDDGEHRHAALRADRREAAEEDAVLGHCEIDARRGQHALAEKAECRDGDADGDQGCAVAAGRRRMTSLAGVWKPASPAGPSAWTQTKATAV